MVLQVKQVLEPLVERFDRLFPPREQSSSSNALEEPLTQRAMPAVSLAGSFAALLSDTGLAAAVLQGTDQSPAGASSAGVVLDGLAQGVAVITAVGQQVTTTRRQERDLVRATAALVAVGPVGRGQQRDDHATRA